MAGIPRYIKRKHLYSRTEFITDLAKTMKISRDEANIIQTYYELILEDALCRCQAVETIFGTVRASSDARSMRVKMKLIPRRGLEEKLTILLKDLED